MKTKLGLLGAAAVLALTLSPQAMAGEGWYISVAGGGVWVDDVDFASVFDPTVTGPNVLDTDTFVVDPGWAVIASTGYGMPMAAPRRHSCATGCSAPCRKTQLCSAPVKRCNRACAA